MANEGDAIAAAIGAPPLGRLDLFIAAWCDPEERAFEQIDAFIQEARGKGWDAGTSQGEYVAAVLYNGLGRYRAAREAATRSRELHYAGGFGLLLSERVEAAVRSDEPELALAVRAELSERTRVGTDWARGVQARADALVSEGDAAETFYRESIERLGLDQPAAKSRTVASGLRRVVAA